MSEQLRFFFDESSTQSKVDDKKKRNWENGFQKWSDDKHINDDSSPYGKCGYGSMCDYCSDNDYGRPCVRALNAMCREKGVHLDYDKVNFEDVWNGEFAPKKEKSNE